MQRLQKSCRSKPIKKFHNDIEEVSGTNAKAILITRSLLQEGAKSYAEANGFMVIQANSIEDYKIVYHKTSYREISLPCLFGTIEDSGILGLTKIVDNHIKKVFEEFTSGISYNIDKINKEDIEEICAIELNKINSKILSGAKSLDIDLLKQYLNIEYNVQIIYHNDSDLLGFCDIEKNIISLNQNIKNTKRELFILCHEFGHFKLHQNLIIDQSSYNNFTESEYNFKIGKHSLSNPKHWIEWQANYFSVSMIIPKTSALAMLWKNQQRLGLKYGKLYLDDQNVNHTNYQIILFRLSNYFNITRPNILYRLQELNHFENRSKTKSIKDLLQDIRGDFHI